MRRAVILVWAVVVALPAFSLDGTVTTSGGGPVPHAFVGILDDSFSMTGHAVTGSDGSFSTDVSGTWMVVQPPASDAVDDLGVYSHQPRMFRLDSAPRADVTLPAASAIVLRAHAPDGSLMRWRDFEARGVFGGVFLYATNLDDEGVPAVVWPVHDAVSRNAGSPREQGLPALFLESGAPCAVQALFWEVPGYGKFLLRADNAGKGFIPAPGKPLVIEYNVELARTAVADLRRRAPAFPPLAALDIEALAARLDAALADAPDAPARAAAADGFLAEALRLRDDLELARARVAITTMDLDEPGFTFGVFDGGPHQSAPFQKARDAGFDMATVLPAWGWTDSRSRQDLQAYDRVLGISALRRMGFTVKAHGVVWMQDYGILPDRARAMPPGELADAALAQARNLHEAWGDLITLWEVANEPATTNAVGLSRAQMTGLVQRSAEQLRAGGATTLVNGPHEVDYGRKYLFFNLDGTPTDGYPQTYSAFLRGAADALDAVDIIGLQFYPGHVLNEELGGYHGPGYTLGWLVDTLERYTRFGKPVHITECSIPSTYKEGWHAGYWRGKPTPELQAELAAAILTIARATPGIESFTWWDITDRKPSVISGGLLNADGSPKPVFTRLSELIAEWAAITGSSNGAQP